MHKPLGDRVLVKLETKDESDGGILLQTAMISSGLVMGLGPEAKKKQADYDDEDKIKVGDHLWLPKGDRLGDKIVEGGDTYLMIPFAHIIGKL